METILDDFNAKLNVHVCFVDIRKAFDSVDHDTLMKKLDEHGLPKCYVNI